MPDITNQQLLKAIDSKIVKVVTASKHDLLQTIKADKQELYDTMKADKQELLVAMTEQLGVITDNMVTKEDLKQFATKEDLSESTNRLDGRLGRIERRIIEGRKVNVQHHLATRKAIGDLTQEHTALREGIAKAVEAI